MIENTPLTITYRLINSLTLDPSNARVHSKRQIKQIAESIKVFGFLVAVLIDASGKIIAGHGRVLAAQLLGWKEVPVIQLDHLSEAQARAFAIADNRLTENSSWDERLLGKALLDLSLQVPDFSLEVTGFTMAEIDIRIEGVTPPAPEAVDDFVPPTGQAVSALRDKWYLGLHRLLCGDALQAESYITLMGDAKADMVFTDPPYNVKVDGHCTGLGANKHREFPMASGEMSQLQFTEFLATACGLMAQHSAAGALHFICMDWRHAQELLAAGEQAYHELKNICVWVKDNGGMGSLYRSQHEFVFVFKQDTASHRNNVELGKYGRYRTNVWNYPGANSFGRKGEEGNALAFHPTVKPVALVADAILDCSARGDVVLDPFIGSGSSILAAERVGRRCCGIELDPLYVDTAIRRWQAITGQQAVHAVSGLTFDSIAATKEASHDA